MDAPRRYKRPRLTGEKSDMQYRASDYSQTDEWLESLMQGMSRVSEAKAQAAFPGHGGYGNQMRITNAGSSPRYTEHPTLTEIHDAPSGFEMYNGCNGEMVGSAEVPKELESVSRGLESIDGVQSLESIAKIMSPGPIDDQRACVSGSVPQSPCGLDIKPEHGDDLSKLDSQTLDLDALLASSGERALSVPLPSPTRTQTMHINDPLPPMIRDENSGDDLPLQSPARLLGHGDVASSSALLSCGRAAQMAQQASS